MAVLLGNTSLSNAQPFHRSMKLPADLRKSHACYAIAWDLKDQTVEATEMHGMHPFLSESKDFQFAPGEGYVGRIWNKNHAASETLSDMQAVDPRLFVRKSVAIVNGILSIHFARRDDGTVLEVGFDTPRGAEEYAPGFDPGAALTFPDKRRGSSICSFGSSSTLWADQTDDNSLDELDDIAFTMVGEDDFADDAWKEIRTRSPSPVKSHIDPPLALSLGSAIKDERTGSMASSPRSTADIPLSCGSRGHPFSCAPACKFSRKGQGCKDGASCTRCHLCFFRRNGMKGGSDDVMLFAFVPLTATVPLCGQSLEADQAMLPFARFGTETDSPFSCHPCETVCSNALPSTGSAGHPHRCGPPCKYARKAQGCKDGFACDRCHLCSFARASAKI